ncbi:MAG: histidinol-phosphate transaminase [Spirochaetales bacterium]|uniref:Histidinol-phosphate aminotransferase n=1 Tax=Candidatus Thalassospirochaeta sargassi TaxID=3119039 RepID=A0AAJ1IHX6_9SPIO|nr:histidinol-phosphate transaminase [Spirochaetales bacterium]
MIANRMKSLTPYVPGEQPQDGKYIKLNTNENPYPPAPAISKFLKEMDITNLKLYPEPTSVKLRTAIAEAEGLKPDNVFAGNGSDEVLSFIFYAFFDADFGPVLFPEFTYSFYPVYSAFYNIPFTKVSLKDDFSINIEDYLNRKTTGMIIPNPNAPTGVYLPINEIRRLLERFPSDRLVAIDEAYIAFGGESAAGLINEFDNLLVIRTFSKSSSLAGIRLGYALGNEKLIQALTTAKDSFNSYPVDYITQKCGELAVKDAEYGNDIAERIIATRKRFVAAASALGWEILPSMANFVFAKKPGRSGEEIYTRLKKQKILVRFFNKPGISDFVRITIGTDEEMETLLSAIKTF